MSHKEAATHLNIAPETVSNYMALALKSLRKQLNPHLETDEKSGTVGRIRNAVTTR
jgi:DNA-directed RNA polymerase specialized sigma24 family protein